MCTENVIKPVCLVSVQQLFDNWLLMFPEPMQPSSFVDYWCQLFILTCTTQIRRREYQWGKRSRLHWSPLLAPRLLATKASVKLFRNAHRQCSLKLFVASVVPRLIFVFSSHRSFPLKLLLTIFFGWCCAHSPLTKSNSINRIPWYGDKVRSSFWNKDNFTFRFRCFFAFHLICIFKIGILLLRQHCVNNLMNKWKTELRGGLLWEECTLILQYVDETWFLIKEESEILSNWHLPIQNRWRNVCVSLWLFLLPRFYNPLRASNLDLSSHLSHKFTGFISHLWIGMLKF